VEPTQLSKHHTSSLPMLMNRIILPAFYWNLSTRSYYLFLRTLSNPELLDSIFYNNSFLAWCRRDSSCGSFSTFNSSEIVWYISDPSNSNTLPIFESLCVVIVVFKLQSHFIFSTLQIVVPIYKMESARYPGSI
jgi:hypothetical protein